MEKFDDVIATIAATGGLGLAATALVDALKAAHRARPRGSA